MNKEELKIHVELELQWLRYYANEDSRRKFNPSMLPYEQLISIGYTKRFIPLDSRCAFLRLTSETLINKEISLESLIEVQSPRDITKNIYSALEIYMLKYPEEHEWVKNALIK